VTAATTERTAEGERTGPSGTGGSGAGGAHDDPGHRGDLTIAPVVVERIAEQAVLEVGGVAGLAKGGVGFGRRRTGADASLGAESAVIDLTIDVRYPAPVAGVADDVRRRVKERVLALAGTRLDVVNVRVQDLVAADPAPARRRVE
jgi:uncharacterized alkaline shock family protein YloU